MKTVNTLRGFFSVQSTGNGKNKRSLLQRKPVRSFWLCAGLIAAAGLLLRLVHLAGFHYSPHVDMVTYLAYGEIFMDSLFGEKPVPPEVLYLTTRNPPGYPYFLGIMRLIFGEGNIRVPLYFQVFLETGTILLFAYVGRILYGARAGLVASLLYCLYRLAIVNSSQLMTETLTMFFCIGAVAAFLSLLERPTWTRAIVTGLLLSAATYLRLNVASLLGVFGLYAALQVWKGRSRHPEQFKVLATRLGAVAGIMIFLLAVWGIRNSLILGQFVPFTGSNAERFLAGANPVTRGEFTGVDKLPPDWRKRLDHPTNTLEGRLARDKVATELAEEFLETNAAHYYLTILPNKLKAFLWDKQFTFAGHGAGAQADLPFGPRFRVPLLESMPLVVLGLVGLFLAGRRHTGFALLLWLLLFLPILFLPIDPRYRFISELPLVLSGAALIDYLFLRHKFRRRFGAVVAVLLVVTAGWSALGWARYSGPNLAALPEVYAHWKSAKALVEEERTIEPTPDRKLPPTRLDMVQVPVDPRHTSHVDVRFDLKANQVGGKAPDFKAWSPVWPQLQVYVGFYDDAGSTVPKSMVFPSRPAGSYFHDGGPVWQVVEIPGTAKSMRLSAMVTGPGSVTLSNLEIRGPVWAP